MTRLRAIACALGLAAILTGCHETTEADMVAYCRSRGGVRSLDLEAEGTDGGGYPRVICMDGKVKAWSE